MVDQLGLDVALNWIVAAACIPCIWYLVRAESPLGGRSAIFLMTCLFVVLVTRGFDWLGFSPLLGRVTSAAATLIPVAMVLYVEHITRRHVWLVLKLLALVGSLFFFLMSVLGQLEGARSLQTAFVAFLCVVMLCNAWHMYREQASLRSEEKRFCRLLFLIALLGIPLAMTDFQVLESHFAARIGAIAVLLFGALLLNARSAIPSVTVFVLRLLMQLVLAVGIAYLLTWLVPGVALVQMLPICFALVVSIALFEGTSRLIAKDDDGDFQRWLAAWPGDGVNPSAHLSQFAVTNHHVRLSDDDLQNYDRVVLSRLSASPISLSHLRFLLTDSDVATVESAEQWIDLLERFEMTHALVGDSDLRDVYLIRSIASDQSSEGAQRLAIIQRMLRSHDA